MTLVTRRTLLAAAAAVLPAVSVAVSPVTQAEAPGVAKTFVLTATRAPQAGRPGTDLAVASSVPWSVAGRAASGMTPFDLADFSGAVSGVLAFLPGATTAVASVTIQPDTEVQGTRAGRFTFGTPSGCVLAGGVTTADFALLDDDAVVVPPPPVVEPSTGPSVLRFDNSTNTGALGNLETLRAATKMFARFAVRVDTLRQLFASGTGIAALALGSGVWKQNPQDDGDQQKRGDGYITPEGGNARFRVEFFPQNGTSPDGGLTTYLNLADLPAAGEALVWFAYRIDPTNTASGVRLRAYTEGGAVLASAEKPGGGSLPSGDNAGRVWLGNGFEKDCRTVSSLAYAYIEFGSGVLTDAQEWAVPTADGTGQRFGYVCQGLPLGARASVPCVTVGGPALPVYGGRVVDPAAGFTTPALLEWELGARQWLDVGISRPFFAVVRDACGHRVPRTDWQWSLSGAGASSFTITEGGEHIRLVGTAAATATLTLTVAGFTKSCTVSAAPAPSLTAVRARIAMLPDLSNPQGPGRRAVPYAEYHAQNVRTLTKGQTYTDPSSGAAVLAVTDAADGVLSQVDYANGGPYVSRPFSGGRLGIYLQVANAGGWCVRIVRPPSHPSGPAVESTYVFSEAVPFRPGSDITARWSPIPGEEHILYFMSTTQGVARVNRWNALANQLEGGGPLPAGFKAFPTYPVGEYSIVVLTMSVDGHRFSWWSLNQVWGFYDATDDTHRMQDNSRIDVNERWLNPEGTFTNMEMGPPSRQSILARTSKEFVQQYPTFENNVHTQTSDDALRPFGSLDLAGYVNLDTGSVNYFSQNRATDPRWGLAAYTVPQFRQPGAPVGERWVLDEGDWETHEGYSGQNVTPGAWVLEADGCYSAPIAEQGPFSQHEVAWVAAWVDNPGAYGYEGGPREDWRAGLQPVASQAALTPGTIYTRFAGGYRVFVRMPDGGSPAGRIRIHSPSSLYQAMRLRTFDMSAARFIGHTFNVSPAKGELKPNGESNDDFSPYGYIRRSFASHSQNGRHVLFQSNQGLRNGPQNVYLLEI